MSYGIPTDRYARSKFSGKRGEYKGPLFLNGLIHLLEHSNTSFEAC